MGFDIMNLQKGRGPVQARSRADEGRAVLKYIDVEDLAPSEDNFCSMLSIEAGLADTWAERTDAGRGNRRPAQVAAAD